MNPWTNPRHKCVVEVMTQLELNLTQVWGGTIDMGARHGSVETAEFWYPGLEEGTHFHVIIAGPFPNGDWKIVEEE